MSRVGKKPIPIPAGVNLTLKDEVLTVKGGKGSLTRSIHPLIEVDIKDNEAAVKPAKEDRKGRALQGLTRSLMTTETFLCLCLSVLCFLRRSLIIFTVSLKAHYVQPLILF